MGETNGHKAAAHSLILMALGRRQEIYGAKG